jgi:hypothetical protein
VPQKPGLSQQGMVAQTPEQGAIDKNQMLFLHAERPSIN